MNIFGEKIKNMVCGPIKKFSLKYFQKILFCHFMKEKTWDLVLCIETYFVYNQFLLKLTIYMNRVTCQSAVLSAGWAGKGDGGS